jgi:ABC-type thiamine transport system ATPase subunit
MRVFSHGEAYLTILQIQLQGKGIYLLDEPEAALSPLKQLSLMAIILEVLKNQKRPIHHRHPFADIDGNTRRNPLRDTGKWHGAGRI